MKKHASLHKIRSTTFNLCASALPFPNDSRQTSSNVFNNDVFGHMHIGCVRTWSAVLQRRLYQQLYYLLTSA